MIRLEMTRVIDGIERGHQKAVTPGELAAVCVEWCGGGNTEEQTRDAMAMQSKLEKGDPVDIRGTRIQRIFVDPVDQSVIEGEAV